jgi:hypothetical protein
MTKSRLRIGPGEGSMQREGAGVAYRYVEGDHVWSGAWDPRDTGAFFPMTTLSWDTPPGEPISPAARERLYDAVWSLQGGPAGLLEEVARFSLWIAARWSRGQEGFLINISGGEIQYMELGHTLRIPAANPPDRLYVALVRLPEPRWTLPEGDAISPEHWRRIVEHVSTARPEDIWIGAHLPWKVVLEER